MGIGHYPSTILEACELRKEFLGNKLLCGGTDLMVTKQSAQHIIFLNQIKEIKEIEVTDNWIKIGAGVTYAQLLEHPNIPYIVKKVIRQIASPAIRNMGTMGGNICNASPAGDTLPILYALEAKVVLAKYSKVLEQVLTRILPIEMFITGVRRLELEQEEMLVSILLPYSKEFPFTYQMYEKVGARQSEAISKASFVGLAAIEDGVVQEIRIAFGAVGKTVVRQKNLEQMMIGKTKKEIQFIRAKIAREYEHYITPIDDQRSTARYRKKVCSHLLKEFLTFQE